MHAIGWKIVLIRYCLFNYEGYWNTIEQPQLTQPSHWRVTHMHLARFKSGTFLSWIIGYRGNPQANYRTNLHVKPWETDPGFHTLSQRIEAIKTQIQTWDLWQWLETENKWSTMLWPPGYGGSPQVDRTNLHVEPWKKDSSLHILPKRTEAIKTQI